MNCPTRKRPYPSERDAQTILGVIWARVRPGRRLASRAYQCPQCQQWHLTKQPRRGGDT